MRSDGRKAEDLRKIKFLKDVNPYAEGSVEVSFGRTKLLVSASVEREVPKWMEKEGTGWITAEYGMLPRSTHTRNRREAASGKQSGRTLEIQRLIGRAMRASLPMNEIPGFTIRLDCDVIVADGGTRTAAISGAWVALTRALRRMAESGALAKEPSVRQVAAVSAGMVNGELLLDLCYDEDSNAEFDMNIVCNDNLDLIEIQGTGEKGVISPKHLNEVLELASAGIRQIMQIQKESLA